MVEKLKDLLKQYSSFSSQEDDDDLDDLNAWVQNGQKKNSSVDPKNTYTSPRKDSKTDAKTVSKIPAPVFKRSTLNLC